jgi:hypothetical protein
MDIIGYLLDIQHTYFDFQIFIFMAECFGINIPSSSHFLFFCQQLENKIIKFN